MASCLVPDPDITVRSSPNNRYYDVGDNLQITCTVVFNDRVSKYIDVNTNAHFKWRKDSNVVVTHDTAPNGIDNSLVYELSYTLLNVALSDAGLYTCEAIISSDTSGVVDSNVMTSAVRITVVGRIIIIMYVLL